MREDIQAHVEGNEAVCEFLAYWLKEAEKGKISFAAAIVAYGPTAVLTGQAGVVGNEFAIYYGCDDIQHRIREGLEERRSPVPRPDAPANEYCFNVIQMALSFDFIPWLMKAEMTRVREGAPGPLKIGFYWGKSGNMDYALNTEQRRQNFNGIALSLIQMIGGVVDQNAVTGRQINDMRFEGVFKAWKEGEALPKFTPPELAVTEMRSALLEKFNGKMPVTITLREAVHFQHRNSKVPEWLKFADWLTARGEAVLFVRDTEKANEDLKGYECCPPASTILQYRAALYSLAKCNLFVSNGPAMLAAFNDQPYLLFQAVNPESPYIPETPDGWRYFTGFNPGGQWPHAGPRQRIIWNKSDTFENIRDAWIEVMEEPQAEAAE